jgi:hypothetical protein
MVRSSSRQHGAVVGGALGRAGEHVVGFADGDEACAGRWVVGVAVWVVGFGEGVELSFFRGRRVSFFLENDI